MIKKVAHEQSVIRPAGIVLALEVAHELHAPDSSPRLPELPAPAAPHLMGLRTSADRPHRRKVPLNRLTALNRLAAVAV
ncbi:hypothetical protein [Streptomyces sp. NPDC005573]|uniref:hypothetical protein n=1 Tax=unclassified Streptomyces TaxID=2593676 RepID=UPI00339F8FEC